MELFSSSSKMPILTQKVCNKHFTRCPKLIYSSKKQFLLDYQTRTKHLPPYIKRRYANFEKQSKELASWERERIVEEARNNNLFFFFFKKPRNHNQASDHFGIYCTKIWYTCQVSIVWSLICPHIKHYFFGWTIVTLSFQ